MNRRRLLAGALAAIAAPTTAWAAAQDTTWQDTTGGEIRRANRAYRRVYRGATQRLVLYQGFATALDARVTWLSDDLRDAIAAHRDFLLRPSPEDQASFREKLFADGKQFIEFMVMIDSGLPRGERLVGDTDDGWRLALAIDDAPAKLLQVERVRHPNPLQRVLYPDQSLWSDFYAVRFDRPAAPKRLVLTFSSGYGNGDLTWG